MNTTGGEGGAKIWLAAANGAIDITDWRSMRCIEQFSSLQQVFREMDVFDSALRLQQAGTADISPHKHTPARACPVMAARKIKTARRRNINNANIYLTALYCQAYPGGGACSRLNLKGVSKGVSQRKRAP